MKLNSRRIAASIMALAVGIAVLNGDAAGRRAFAQSIPDPNGDPAWRAAWVQSIPFLDARLIATNIPGASALAQVGTFRKADPNKPPDTCHPTPIPTAFPSYILPGAVLDPIRILVGSRSNFGAPLAAGAGQEGSFISVDPTGPGTLGVPENFARSGTQASAHGGRVQMFSANSPQWLNGVNNSGANTKQYTGVSNPLGLSNNYAFGRIWPANAPFGAGGVGSSSILDPTGRPLKGAPNALIGGVYVGKLTDRDQVTSAPQIIPGTLNTGAVGTAFIGPSPDGSCKAVFAVVTADGAIVQEHTLKGLDGLASSGTIDALQGHSWGPPLQGVEPRLGVMMNPYVTDQPPSVALQLFVSEPFKNTIAVINLVIGGPSGPPSNQVFRSSNIKRISSRVLNQPVDFAPAMMCCTNDTDSINWASNTTLDQGSDFYVANRGDNTIVRMKQDGSVVALRRVTIGGGNPLGGAKLNGIATSVDGTKIYVTFTGPGEKEQGGLLQLPAFGR